MLIVMDLLSCQIQAMQAAINKIPSETPASPGSPGTEDGNYLFDEEGNEKEKPPIQSFGHFKNKCQHDVIESDAKAVAEDGLG